MKHFLAKLLSNILLGLGLVFMVSPIILYWFIHGDYERYIWIVNGPYPFNSFGGGPFQLIFYLGLLMVGVGLVTSSLIMKKCLHL